MHVFTKARCNLVVVLRYLLWRSQQLVSLVASFGAGTCFKNWGKCTLGVGYDFVVTFRFEPLGGVYDTIFTC